jgi:4-amino-4-deoxy-L-arabinose transferase-like glycosyltransferase
MQNAECRIQNEYAATAGLSFCILHSAFCIFLFLLLCGFLFFYRLADRDLWSSHEARAAMDAQGVLDGSAVLVPHLFDGRSELQKPPLYYWLVAGFGRIGGGVDAWAVRLPAALSATACVLGLALFGGLCGRRREGLLAAVMLATAAHFTWLARIGRIDMPLTLTTGVSTCAAFLAFQRSRFSTLSLIVAYLAAAAGVLLKGPIGIVLPAAAITAFLVGEGAWPAAWEFRDWWALVRRLGIWWGVPLVVLLTLPWFVAADEDTGGELLRVFFWRHNVERALGGGPLRSNPWWFYGPQFVVDFLPWSPFVLIAAVWGWRRGFLREDPLARLGLAWFLGVLTVLSCAGFKRADYLLPAYPGAALFLGCVAARLGERHGWLVDRAIPAGLAIVMLVVWAVRLEITLPAQEPYRNYRPLAAVIRQAAPTPAEVVFFRTEAHALAFRVGRPLAVLVEWSDLEGRLVKPGPHYVVTPPACVAECRDRLAGLSWEPVTGTVDLAGGAHERPLVFLRVTHPDGYVSTRP